MLLPQKYIFVLIYTLLYLKKMVFSSFGCIMCLVKMNLVSGLVINRWWKVWGTCPLPPFGVEWDWGHYWPVVPVPDGDECGATGGMLGRGNWSIWRKPDPLQLCPPQIPHALTQAAKVESRRLIAWVTARPMGLLALILRNIRRWIVNFVLRAFTSPFVFQFS
jgi:hypothetical protein